MGKRLIISALLVAVISFGFYFLNRSEDLSYSLDTAENLRDIKLNVIEGNGLRVLVFLLEHWPTSVLLPQLTRSVTRFDLVRRFASTIDLPPSWTPLTPPKSDVEEEATVASKTLDNDIEEIVKRGSSRTRGFKFVTAADYVAAYRSNRTTPLAVAQKLLENIAASNELQKPLGAYISIDAEDFLAQAEASTRRYQEGKTLSVLDGVPLAIKDEIDVKGYPTTVGTAFINENNPAKEDAFAVGQARKRGLLIAGKLNMQEIGIGVTGHNPHHGIARNPYNLSYYPGGSSSGSASSVASGLVPFSLGADGGGSVRIPSGLCGLVGLKPTYGRVSESGAFPLCWSVGHLGPLAASTADAALLYSVISGKDLHDSNSLLQPPHHLLNYLDDLVHNNSKPLAGVRIGVHPVFTKRSNPVVLQAYEKSLEVLKEKGAELVELAPIHINAVSKAHTVVIVSEMSTAMDRYKVNNSLFGLETRASLSLANQLSSRDYVAANKVRAWALRYFEDIFKDVDLIIAPTTPSLAPAIRESSPEGISDVTTVSLLMSRFI
eukprot:TRINITY_DN2141_c0_g1_i2.p1 TRINITY_DN2141_c0_g1~~TRINITY_DN2141_c0_g1_i2.p1  ORF type:complete len:548 (+),score=106.58 TRINITY_DN2141_c0_g1_i2:3-1646(+)